MNVNADFHKKEDWFRTTPVVIEKIIRLPEEEFNQFRWNLLDEYPFIEENKALMREDQYGAYHCLLLLGEGMVCDDGILVHSRGCAFAYYSALMPGAWNLIRLQIKEIADAMILEGTQKTQDGSWKFDYGKINERFGIAVAKDNGFDELLFAELKERQEVSGIVMTEDCAQMHFHPQYFDSNQDDAQTMEELT